MSLLTATTVTLEDLQSDLQDTLTRAFRGRSPYKKVYAIFFRFSNDDLNVEPLEQELVETFEKWFGYSTERFVIQASSPVAPTVAVVDRLSTCIKDGWGEEGNLIILVYSGHGTIQTSSRKQTLVLGGAPNRRGNLEPTLPWVDATAMLNHVAADVLHILDCCYAAEATSTEAEILAATSGTEKAEARIEYSFTRALNVQLRLLHTEKFMTVADLHTRILEERRALQLTYLPFYAARFGKASIRIQRMTDSAQARHMDISPNSPRVIMTAHVEGKIDEESIREMKGWLSTYMSKQIKNIEVRLVGAWETNSAILIIEMPLLLWSLLPPRLAYKKLEIVYSKNKLVEEASTITLASRPLPGSENQKPGYGSSLK